MYSLSEQFTQSCAGANRQIAVRALFNGTAVIDGANIIDCRFIETLSGDSGVSVGSTCACELTMNLLVTSEILPLTNGTVMPEVGVFTGDETEYVPLGRFFISEVSTQNGYKTATIHAYDMMSRLEEDYEPKISLPASCLSVVTDIAAQYGFSLDESIVFPDGDLITGAEYTAREMLGFIAALMGTNAHFDRDGKLTFRFYRECDVTIGSGVQYSGAMQRLTESDYTIGSVVTGTQENVISVGNGTAVEFANPFITQEIAQQIHSRLQGKSFTPASVRWRGNPALETGDIVSLEAQDGTIHEFWIMAQDMRISGGLSVTSYCYGRSDAQINITVSPTERKLTEAKRQLETAIATASQLINGASGGIFRVSDSDGDGINDGWILSQSADVTVKGKCIVANYEGIGISEDGGSSYTQAITHDGINASAVTAGTMTAEHIHGGTLTLGGADNASGRMELYNADGELIAAVDKDGYNAFGTSDGGVKGRMLLNDASLSFGRQSEESPTFVISAEYSDGVSRENELQVHVPSTDDFQIIDENAVGRLGIYNDGAFTVRDKESNPKITANSDGDIYLRGGNIYFFNSEKALPVLEAADGSYTILRHGDPNIDHAIMIGTGGVRFVESGAERVPWHSGNLSLAALGFEVATGQGTLNADGSYKTFYFSNVNGSGTAFSKSPVVTCTYGVNGDTIASGDFLPIKIKNVGKSSFQAAYGGTGGAAYPFFYTAIAI